MPTKPSKTFPDDQSTNQTVAENFARLRAILGYSLAEVAERMNNRLNKTQLHRIEHAGSGDGSREISVRELTLLSVALGVPPNVLLLPWGDCDITGDDDSYERHTTPSTITGAAELKASALQLWGYGDEAPLVIDCARENRLVRHFRARVLRQPEVLSFLHTLSASSPHMAQDFLDQQIRGAIGESIESAIQRASIGRANSTERWGNLDDLGDEFGSFTPNAQMSQCAEPGYWKDEEHRRSLIEDSTKWLETRRSLTMMLEELRIAPDSTFDNRPSLERQLKDELAACDDWSVCHIWDYAGFRIEPDLVDVDMFKCVWNTSEFPSTTVILNLSFQERWR